MSTSGKYLKKYWFWAALLLVLYPVWTFYRPLPSIKPQNSLVVTNVRTKPATLVWPSYGQSAILVKDINYTNHKGIIKPQPVASVAKLIAALCVLQVKPINSPSTSPIIKLGSTDEQIYAKYLLQDGSILPVSVNEQISEYDTLQGMLLPSANNLADSLAIWAFGSMNSYIAYANTFLKTHGLQNTTVATDASGFSPSTTSTAPDLLKLGELALNQPIIAGIVSKPTAALTTGQTVTNVDSLLGKSNIVGIKTGNSEQAGGVFLSASKVTINGKKVTIITSIQGAPDITKALKDSLTLVNSAQANFKKVTLIKAGDTVGTYKLPWGGTISAVASKDLVDTVWQGSDASVTTSLKSITTSTTAKTNVGAVKANASIPAVLKSAPSKPSYLWRLFHPIY